MRYSYEGKPQSVRRVGVTAASNTATHILHKFVSRVATSCLLVVELKIRWHQLCYGIIQLTNQKFKIAAGTKLEISIFTRFTCNHVIKSSKS
jgi:hypothetical protein